MPCRHILLRHQHVAGLFQRQRPAEPTQQYRSGKARLLHPQDSKEGERIWDLLPQHFKPLSLPDPY